MPLVPPSRTSVPSVVPGLVWVTLGSSAANVAGYLLHLPASRWLGPEQYGVLASLLAVQLVAAVPALAVQTVVARDVARERGTGARHLVLRTAAVLAVLGALAVVPVSAALDVPVAATGAALLTAPVLVLVSGELGLLQGASRFARLGVALALVGLLRVGPAVGALAVGGGPTAALAGGAVGGLAALAVARGLAGAPPRAAAPGAADLAGVARASQVQLVLILLTSLDLLVARAVLDGTEAGLYALGAVAAKAAFWLPQAVGVVLYPSLADPARRGAALRTAVAVLVALGAVVVVAAAVAGPVVPVVVGEAYDGVSGLLWLFALQGAALAVLQSALLSGVARDRTRVAALVWCGVLVESVLLAVGHGSLTEVLLVATGAAVVLAAATTARELRGSRAGDRQRRPRS